MAKIIYEVKENKNTKSAAYGKHFAQVKNLETLNTRRLAQHISEHGSIYTPDVVYGVLERFRACLVEMLLESKKVKIDGLGTFYCTLENQPGGAQKKEDFNVGKHLKALHIRFLPEQATELNISSREFLKKAEFINIYYGADVTADDVIDLIYSLKRPYRKNAVFLTNDKCVAALRKLKDENGQFLWQPSLQAGEPDTCLGYKIYTSPFFPEPGPNKAVLAFGYFSYYNIGDRGPRSFAELKELFAGNGMVGFVAKERVDGKLVLPEAIKLLKTGGTKSAGK